ncbi:6-hydroxymethylpterin diphosphokinase MptE-like protein [Synechococcus sp. HK01-R]|uniref:6-hydroxymethylpterin diphosphokinase MptE-like protein n=1 Tax=Synechococcus sp. HK01-R TaxID=2751171 RepID=UPI001626EE60|nr:6-hydroxymethylpterin diphosphokinase MptE-like protein [Synechococcus sp. HK01-R]QNG27761.1 DUF115 domain-containing protein [Synechococcus sp. HK01-R]
MPDLAGQTLQRNRLWLAQAAPALAAELSDEAVNGITLRQCSIDADGDQADCDLYFADERALEGCNQTLAALLSQQLKRTDGVAMPRPLRSSSLENASEPGSILAEMVNKHREVLLDHLPAIPASDAVLGIQKPPYRNLVIFGSLMLVPLLPYLQSLPNSPWISLTLIEDDPKQLAATLSLINLEALVDLCRSQAISLTLHMDESKTNLQDRLYTQLSSDNPTLLYGWQTLRSPVRSPVLMELHSWLHAPEGAAQHVLGLLGFATDEINQTHQALWNALTQKPLRVLAPEQLRADVPVVLVASGPSLDDQLTWLREYQQTLNLVAAGSALGALLRAGIRPAAVVFLERDSEVYAVLCDLLADGFSLDGITLLASSTIDPRVPALFSQTAFFHRPVAAATGLFPNDQSATLPVCGPHVINAALEALLCLGSRQLLLVGADFAARQRDYPRAEGALGESPREFTIPVRGNLGRTVFSEPGLLHTGYLLNRVIVSTPQAQVWRLGEGAVLEAAQTVKSSTELAQRFGSAPNALAAALQELPSTSFSRDDCSGFFDLVETDLQAWAEELSQAAEVAEGWSRPLAEAIAPLLQRLHDGDSRQRRLLAQLLCQPLFFSAMSMHDAPSGDQKVFAHARHQFLASVQLMQAVVRQWIAVMRPWLRAPQLPLWDPEWIRSRFCRSVA